MSVYVLYEDGCVAGGATFSPARYFEGQTEAMSAFEDEAEKLTAVLHAEVVADAESRSPDEVVDYMGGGEGTSLELTLQEEDGEGHVERVVASSKAGIGDVFDEFGYSGSTWKVEVVSRDADGYVLDLLETFTAYAGSDWELLAREALGRGVREAGCKPGVSSIELYVTAYIEVDDDGGDGRGDVVLHETVETARRKERA